MIHTNFNSKTSLVMKLSQINPNSINDEIYEDTDVSELVKSISNNGLLEPLVISKDGILISGHRRFKALQQLGIEDVEVRIVDTDNPIITLIEFNKYRTKTNTDILRESRFLQEELKKQIGKGRKAANERGGKRLSLDLELAKRLNVGTTRLKQLRSIENYRPELIADIETGKISVSAAYKKVQSGFSKPVKNKGSQFKTQFKKFLTSHNPTYDEIIGTIRSTYPYCLDTTGINELQRSELLDHLKSIQTMSSDELMLVQKKDELDELNLSKREKDSTKKLLPTFEELEDWNKQINKSRVLKDGRTNPLDEILVISPEDKHEGLDTTMWGTLRQTISSAYMQEGPGRSMKYFIGFKLNKQFKLLGIVQLSSSAQRMESRDSLIGWDDQQRAKNRECVLNMQTCVATQPFGHNRLGMKFLCCLIPEMVKKYEEKYNQRVVAVTTTSLHGQQSAYQGMKKWVQSIGITTGEMFIKPLRQEWRFWNDWLRSHYQDEMNEISLQSSPLQTKLRFLYQTLGFNPKELTHNHKRGVYMIPLYENYIQFLNDEIKEKKLIPVKFKWQDWWIAKSRTRFESLREQNRLNTDQLFYDEIEMDYLSEWLKSRGL